MDVETVSEAFAQLLQTKGIATFGQDLFIAQVPDSAPDKTYWLVTSGGSPLERLATGEQVKQYFISVYYRSTKAADVEKNLFRLEELLNCLRCVELQNFELHDITASAFPSDEDLDGENRRVGMLQTQIKIYKKEC